MQPLRFLIVALIAAYAVALHTLLSAFAVVAPADGAAHIAERCSSAAASGGPAPPASHDVACAFACAMSGGTTAPVTASGVTIAAPVCALRLGPAADAASPSRNAEGPPRARAPPPA